jgi:hypothetical protein
MRNRPSRVVRLRLEQRDVARDSEESEYGEIGGNGREEEREEVGGRCRGVKIRRGGELGDFGSGESEDLVDVFEFVGVAGERKVDEGDEEGGNVLEGKVRSGLNKKDETSSVRLSIPLSKMSKGNERETDLDKLDDLMPEDLEELDVLWNSSKFSDRLLSLVDFLPLALVELLAIRICLAVLFLLPIFRALSSLLTVLLCFTTTPNSSLSLLRSLLLPILLSLPSADPRPSDLLRQTLGGLLLSFLLLFGRLILGFASGVRGESIDEGDDNLLDVDPRVEKGCGGEERREGEEVELVGEDLKRRPKLLDQ